MRNVFITGATGFLGSYLLKRILDDGDTRPIVLARGKKTGSAAERVKNIAKYFYGGNYATALKRIRVVEGEVDKEFLGIDNAIRKPLIKEVDEIYHSAAIAEFRIPLDRIRRSNVIGTENVLKFAMECKASGHMKKLNHISTTFVAGKKSGVFYEKDLDVGQKFNNTYEQSKFEAEILVHKYMKKGLTAAIFRPSILTGDYVAGRTSNFKMLYQPLRFFVRELFDAIPADRSTCFNMIPVDFTAEAICAITKENESIGGTYHIANTRIMPLGSFIDVASDFFGFKKPEFVPLKDFSMNTLTTVQKNLIEPYIPYFNYKTIFDSVNTMDMLEEKGFQCPIVDTDFLVKLFKFCDETGFMKRKKRYVTAG
ncbi:MAG: SDR family oxidoreductase [Candidatus Omnitrophica bacterium]|nr:SDR family oxidoreductase [Candidatus Omnitrophota bacterium]